ncbi:MAG: hypothetical protein AAF944_20565 [Bacteroidota bacterium]
MKAPFDPKLKAALQQRQNGESGLTRANLLNPRKKQAKITLDGKTYVIRQVGSKVTQ